MTRKTLKESARELDEFMDRDDNDLYGNGWGDPIDKNEDDER
jgi:hypothetical protein